MRVGSCFREDLPFFFFVISAKTVLWKVGRFRITLRTNSTVDLICAVSKEKLVQVTICFVEGYYKIFMTEDRVISRMCKCTFICILPKTWQPEVFSNVDYLGKVKIIYASLYIKTCMLNVKKSLHQHSWTNKCIMGMWSTSMMSCKNYDMWKGGGFCSPRRTDTTMAYLIYIYKRSDSDVQGIPVGVISKAR